MNTALTVIGRAAIGYPWIFNEIKHFFKTGEHLETYCYR
jgi:tRNA-dihydrouridine synthase